MKPRLTSIEDENILLAEYLNGILFLLKSCSYNYKFFKSTNFLFVLFCYTIVIVRSKSVCFLIISID